MLSNKLNLTSLEDIEHCINNLRTHGKEWATIFMTAAIDQSADNNFAFIVQLGDYMESLLDLADPPSYEVPWFRLRCMFSDFASQGQICICIVIATYDMKLPPDLEEQEYFEDVMTDRIKSLFPALDEHIPDIVVMNRQDKLCLILNQDLCKERFILNFAKPVFKTESSQ